MNRILPPPPFLSTNNFRYFSINGNVLASFLEYQNRAYCILRGPFGKKVVLFDYNQGAEIEPEYLDKPTGLHPPPGNMNIYKHKFFPDAVNLVPKVRADFSIPDINSIFTGRSEDLYQIEQLRKVFHHATNFEEELVNERLDNPTDWPQCKPGKKSEKFL